MGTSTSKLTKILASKADAKAAIIEMGVSCDNELDKYGDRIREIRTPIPPPPPPGTSTLLRPVSITGPSGAANYTSNSVIGNSNDAFGWQITTLSENGIKMTYNGDVIGGATYILGGNVVSDIWARVPYVNNVNSLIMAPGSLSSEYNITFAFSLPEDFEITADTMVEFAITNCLIDGMSIYQGHLQNVYMRLTNEDIV